ncbi:MAG TPA: phosphopyruvate hydratase [Candidatus Paceibacterota bacterium]|nr:phosphopyruvate hydratase [Candidatus Paceibacterota bacterium]
MKKIKTITGREILDSRGNPTIEVVCELEGGFSGVASVPSGASTGKHEALELRDGDTERYHGLGTLKAIANVNGEIRSSIEGKEFDQKSLDAFLIELDGTENKSRLGGNALLGISLSFARASALADGSELYEYLGDLAENKNFKMPKLMLNVINGGKHADSGLDVQEFMLIPFEFDSVSESMRAGAEIIHVLRKMLTEDGYATSVGDEGGFAPKLSSNDEALGYLVKAINSAGYEGQVKLGMDVAASSFYEDGIYKIHHDGKIKHMTNEQLTEWYTKLSEDYPLISIEDGVEEDDWKGFKHMMEKIGNEIQIVGDDLTVTNPDRIKMAIEKGAVNAVIIKPNQIGTLSETLEAIRIAKEAKMAIVVSHRSGETTDNFIADLAVAVSAEYIKSGSLARGERICKYNRLLEIEDKIA